MELQITLRDFDRDPISDDIREQLRASLGVTDDDDFENRLIALAEASATEYIEMLIGRGMANRADEAKQDRLFYLIKNVFAPRLPSEDDISMMFQLTITQARTLLRNTISRYRTRLRDEITSTLEATFNSADQQQEGWHVFIASPVFAELLNVIVTKEGPDLNPIRKRSVGTQQYFISNDTHTALGNHFGN